MLGRRHGTPVPEGYERTRRADPVAFELRRGLRGGRPFETRAFEGGSANAPSSTLGPRDEPVEGTYRIPVLLGLYENSGAQPPFVRETVRDAYFGSGSGTITDYYAEMSGGRVTLLGDLSDWARTSRPDTAYTVGESGLVTGSLGGAGAGNFVYDLLSLQAGIDWGPYDNDGPDGIPNSGDDDGYVDILAVVHPTRGAECGGSGSDDRIWSHRWSLSGAITDAGPYETGTRSAKGGFILVDDYIIQPAISCEHAGLNEIGVFTHELGHAFGLPDLYDTCSSSSLCPEDTTSHSGAGVWDLMAAGTWGCDDASPEKPCHMGAWTKAALGWVDVVVLGPDTDHGTVSVPPVETSGTVYRVDANDGSGEYFLLENRRRIGFDANLLGEGLLVWQIDPDWVEERWATNRVNANAHQGVWLRQADGRNDLGRGAGRGDGGDPFPGASVNTAFHATTTPAAVSFGGGVTGVTLVDIQASQEDMTLRASTRFTTVRLEAQGTDGTDGIFTLDGQAVDPPSTTFASAPFTTRSVEAAAGEAVGPGERRPFLEWLDDTSAHRLRTLVTPMTDTSLVARYGGIQVELALTTTGGVGSVEPGGFESDPPSDDFWFELGAEVTLRAVPRTGFSFLAWSGALAGQANPASVTMDVPRSAGAEFEMIYGIPDQALEFPGATPLHIELRVEHGVEPVRWRVLSGALPTGVRLSREGVLSGAALRMGSFPVTLEAVDARGLPASTTVEVRVSAPALTIEQLTSPFLLSGEPLTDAQINFLNLQGNGIAPYDIGDFRAWVLADPTLPLSGAVQGVVRRTLVLDVETGGRPGTDGREGRR